MGGLVPALEVAWEHGFCQVMAECDSRTVVQFKSEHWRSTTTNTKPYPTKWGQITLWWSSSVS